MCRGAVNGYKWTDHLARNLVRYLWEVVHSAEVLDFGEVAQSMEHHQWEDVLLDGGTGSGQALDSAQVMERLFDISTV